MKLAKRYCVYCSPEVWERIRRRARKWKIPISRLGYLCCRRAADEGAGEAPKPSGHPLVLTEDRQRRLCEDALYVSRSGRFVFRAPGGGKATVTVGEKATVTVGEAARLLLLAEEEGLS